MSTAPGGAGDRVVSSAAASPNGRGELPVWLPSGSEHVFAILHLPAETAVRPTAVLVCSPFGWEEESGHRGVANWARALAAAGHPALRLDFPGTRNSTGDRSARFPDRWTAAVADAADWLRARTGAPRVALLGIGLGGLIGCDAVLDGAAIDDLILWAVPAAGRRAMRELRAHARMIAARYPDDATSPEPGAPMEAVGYALDVAAVAAFEAITLTDRILPDGHRRRALLMGRDGLAVDERLEAHLTQAGVTVSNQPGPGYALLTGEPQGSRAPTETIATTIGWLGGDLPPGESLATAIPSGERTGGVAPAVPVVAFEHRGAPIRETAVRLRGRSEDLFAIVTEPAEPLDATCVVLFNSGSLSHAGPNRLWVELARRWATLGVRTVRVDFPGIGETPGDGDGLVDDNVFYEPVWIDETVGLLDALQGQGLAARFVLCGLCSGAYWAWQAALRDDRVVGAMLLNLWTFFYSRELVAERAPGDVLGRLRQQGFGRLIRRDVSREKLVEAIRAVRPRRMLAGARHSVERDQRSEIVRALDGLRARQLETILLFGLGEPMYQQMERDGLLTQRDRWPQLSVQRLPTSDHMFRALTVQREVHTQLDAGLAQIRDRAGVLDPGRT
ncbi:MAG: hypothetical protein ACR2NR_04625 [Solirubrobacteraceae bacterium]